MEIDLIGKKVNGLLNSAPANQIERRNFRVGSGGRTKFAETLRRTHITQTGREDFRSAHRYDSISHGAEQQSRATELVLGVSPIRRAPNEAEAIDKFWGKPDGERRF